jgi:hypothetical protein
VTAVTRARNRRTEFRRMQHDRIRTSIPVEIVVSGRLSEGTIRNASAGGMFVETRAIPPQGESVTVRFSPHSKAKLDVAGLVWWTTDGSRSRHRWRGFGMRLLADDARYDELLAGLRPPAASAQRLMAPRAITASQRKALVAAYEETRGSGRSPRSR